MFVKGEIGRRKGGGEGEGEGKGEGGGGGGAFSRVSRVSKDKLYSRKSIIDDER